MNQPQESETLENHEADGDQYLTFCLADEHYGVDILRVQEIRGWEAVTRVPTAPGYVKGVLNLRGAIVPIYDLRLKFAMPVAPYDKQTVVVVMRVRSGGEERSMGVVVDAVSDVLVVREPSVVRTPDFGARLPTEAIRGLVNDGETMVMLLDVDQLIEDEAGPLAAA